MNAPPPVVVTNPAVQGQQVLPVQQGMTSQPQIVVIQAPSSPELKMGDNQQACVTVMGFMQLAIGCFCIFCQIGAFIVQSHFANVGTGLWGGIFFIITGVFGFMGGRKKSERLVITFLIMSVVSALVAIMVVSMAAVGVFVDGVFAIDTLLLLLGLGELFIAIVSSGIGCGVLCCRDQDQTAGTVQYVDARGQPVQYINTAGGQMVVAQPGTVIVQPQMAGVSQPQATCPTQQWQQGPPQQGPPQQAPPAAVAGPYQPQGPPPYTKQGPVKRDLAGVHGVKATLPPSHAPPPYNPATIRATYI